MVGVPRRWASEGSTPSHATPPNKPSKDDPMNETPARHQWKRRAIASREELRRILSVEYGHPRDEITAMIDDTARYGEARIVAIGPREFLSYLNGTWYITKGTEQ